MNQIEFIEAFREKFPELLVNMPPVGIGIVTGDVVVFLIENLPKLVEEEKKGWQEYFIQAHAAEVSNAEHECLREGCADGVKMERNRILNLPAMKMEEEEVCMKLYCNCNTVRRTRNSLRKELLKQIGSL